MLVVIRLGEGKPNSRQPEDILEEVIAETPAEVGQKAWLLLVEVCKGVYDYPNPGIIRVRSGGFIAALPFHSNLLIACFVQRSADHLWHPSPILIWNGSTLKVSYCLPRDDVARAAVRSARREATDVQGWQG